MRPILSDIRALSGVTGVAVVAKRDGRIEHLFPAAFTERHTEYLLGLVTSTYQRLHGFIRLALRFERVVIHLYNQPEYLLFITVLPDVDIQHFETVVNSKFGAISRALAKPPSESQRTEPAAQSGRLGTTPTRRDPANDPVLILIGACNALTVFLADSRGRLRLAADWRRARDMANVRGDLLSGLVVDSGGRLDLRKGQTLPPSSTVIATFAQMIELFLDSLDTGRTRAEEELYALLEPHRGVLEPSGLYMYLGRQSRAGAAPSASRG
ncbi:MAG: hypothetical protein HY304_02500 [candidate division Zixibacteria bacterium]|nr:hypothetical protein [candidate division Zixibacteria bacterium]